MAENTLKKMNTKFAGHHVSSGGFIFYKDKQSRKLYILLIKNKKGEWWIPKGHIEESEDQVEAAFREIEEEVGFKKDQLQHIGLSHVYAFSFTDEKGQPNTKEIYMNVFEVAEMHSVIVEQGETDIREVHWFPYEKGLKIILPFSKNELSKAKEMYELHLDKAK